MTMIMYSLRMVLWLISKESSLELRTHLKFEEKNGKWKVLEQPFREIHRIIKEEDVYIRHCLEAKDRYADVNLLPNRQPTDERISSFRLKLPIPKLKRALNIKEILEKKSTLQTLLLLLVLLGTSMIIGDGPTPNVDIVLSICLQSDLSGFSRTRWEKWDFETIACRSCACYK